MVYIYTHTHNNILVEIHISVCIYTHTYINSLLELWDLIEMVEIPNIETYAKVEYLIESYLVRL